MCGFKSFVSVVLVSSAICAVTPRAALADADDVADVAGTAAELSEYSAMISDYAEFLTDQELVTNTKTLNRLSSITKKFGQAAYALGFASVAFDFISQLAGAQSEMDIIVEKLDQIDGKIDKLSTKMEMLANDLDRANDYRHLTTQFSAIAGRIASRHEQLAVHIKALSEGKSSSYDTSQTDMDFSTLATRLSYHCSGENAAKNMFHVTEAHFGGQTVPIAQWSTMVMARLQQAQMVSSFLKVAQDLKAAGNPPQGSQRNALITAALQEVGRDYDSAWQRCEAGMRASDKRLRSSKTVFDYSKPIFDRAVLVEQATGLQSDRPGYISFSRRLGKQLEEHFTNTGWIVLLYRAEGKRGYENHYMNGYVNRTHTQFSVPIRTGNSDAIWNIVAHYYFLDEEERDVDRIWLQAFGILPDVLPRLSDDFKLNTLLTLTDWRGFVWLARSPLEMWSFYLSRDDTKVHHDTSSSSGLAYVYSR